MRDTDPELARRLDAARASGAPLQIVVQVERAPGVAPVPAEIEEKTRRAVSRASAATGETPLDVHVMGRVAAAYVQGSERFLRELVAQPEITSAVPNSAEE
jgi:hypothetical protein